MLRVVAKTLREGILVKMRGVRVNRHNRPLKRRLVGYNDSAYGAPYGSGILRDYSEFFMVKMSDVAKRAGVSIPTVSFVLNGKQSRQTISEATQQRVWQAVEELGYRRNHAAKAMRTGLFNCAALVLSTTPQRSHLPPPLLSGILNELEAHGMHLVITKISDDKLTNAKYLPGILRECMADGLLIDYTNDAPAQMQPLIDSFHIPAIWINIQRERDCVFPNDTKAGRDATEYLIGMGHRQVAYLQAPQSVHYSNAARRGGYEMAMQAHGLAARVIDVPLDRSPGEQRQQMVRALQQELPTAIVAYDHAIAAPFYHVACVEMGLRIPEELSLLLMHHEPFHEVGNHVTTWGIPFREVGRRAVEALLKRISNPEEILPPAAIDFDFSPLYEGATCAPPRQI